MKTQKIRLLAVALTLIMIFSIFPISLNAAASSLTAIPTDSPVLVNGKNASFDAYTISGNNYFKLRDLAYILNGTNKQFAVGYDNDTKAITLTSGSAYTAVGGEMSSKAAGNKTPVLTASKIYLDEKEVYFTVYTIDGNNYFKLRDIMQALNIYVGYDSATRTITIDTEKDYVPELPAPDVTVSNENEFRQAVGRAGSKATVIGITRDIELISNFSLPAGATITLISVGEKRFDIISTRDMDVITVPKDASLTIEHIGITHTPGTSGSGIVNEGIFIMNSGVIYGNSVAANGAGVNNSGAFTMNSGTIRDNFSGSSRLSSRENGGGVFSTGTFTMNGGTITGNSATSSGGGVYSPGISYNAGKIISISFTINGGTISGNSASNGGGVYGALKLNNGIISNNETRKDGMIIGSIEMNGGVITQAEGVALQLDKNSNMSRGTINGNVIVGTSNSFTMENGEINGRLIITSNAFLYDKGSFIMNDGKVGGVDNFGGQFTMNAGTIGGKGIGVNMGRMFGTYAGTYYGSFTMNGGTITGNNEGGVIVGNGCTFIMNDGSIHGNTTTSSGGGVDTSGTFTMTGGTIRNNTSGESGGGVNHADGTFTFDGGWIYNNTAENGNDIQIAKTGTFNNNVLDNNVGGIGSPPPKEAE